VTHSDANPSEFNQKVKLKEFITLHHELMTVIEKPTYKNINETNLKDEIDNICLNEIINIFIADSNQVGNNSSSFLTDVKKFAINMKKM
jgi:hypothetical protein